MQGVEEQGDVPPLPTTSTVPEGGVGNPASEMTSPTTTTTTAADVTPGPTITEQSNIIIQADKKEQMPGRKAEAQKVDMTEHLLTLEQAQAHFEVSLDVTNPIRSGGLSPAEAVTRLEKYGPNQLSPPKTIHPFLVFLGFVADRFNVLLIICGIINFALLGAKYNIYNIVIGCFLIFVAFLNASISYYQQQKSQAIMESFLKLIPAKCYVIRDSKLTNIPAIDLVFGDIVYVRSGDKIPADIMIFASSDLKVDNSSLTGEAEALERSKNNTHANPLEATNLIFNGTLAVNGECYGIVVRTGDNTVIGQIASLTANEERRVSPMTEEVEYFVNLLTYVALVFALIFFCIAITVGGQSAALSINFAIGTVIGFIPEGLPATMSILLTIAAKRMATRQVLVKDLIGVETLGAITLLATDKTGTLTRNQMTVTYMWTGFKLYLATSSSTPDPHGALQLDTENRGVAEVLMNSGLNTRAKFSTMEGPITTRPILGDATEVGLYRNAALKMDDVVGLPEKYPKVCEVPFNSDNKWALTIVKRPTDESVYTIYLKGAPERVLRLCSHIYDGTGISILGEDAELRFEQTYRLMASKGHRVLAFASLVLPASSFPEGFEFKKDPINYPTTGLCFDGLVSLEDPPKHGVREAIGHCREAGIRVMMVTGDHPLTAEAIGRKINLMLQDTRQTLAVKRNVPEESIKESEVNAIVIHGERVDKLTDEDWDIIFSKEEIIFARTSPKHKLQIVKHAQSLGHIVGVTGDGVNDSPALKKADLGIAMNESGSDVSKEAAAMILIDDNFASCVHGIEEGRLIFQNLKKSIRYTITHTMPQVLANLMMIIVPLPLPLSAIQILFVDLGFELFLALSFAWDMPENKKALMKMAPRKPVNSVSIARLRRRNADQAADDIRDKNFIEKYHPSIVGPIRQIRSFFTLRYWKDFFEKSDEEVLIDSEMLCWAYLEGGIIEFIFCMIAYFWAMYNVYGVTPYNARQNAKAYNEAEDPNTFEYKVISMGQSAFWVALMIQQCFNLFINKSRFGLPFGAHMFNNIYTFVGIVFGAALIMFLVYTPGVSVGFQTNRDLPPLIWLAGVGGGVFLFIYSIIRTLILRARNPIKYTKDIEGLQMFPTRWSSMRG